MKFQPSAAAGRSSDFIKYVDEREQEAHFLTSGLHLPLAPLLQVMTVACHASSEVRDGQRLRAPHGVYQTKSDITLPHLRELVNFT